MAYNELTERIREDWGTLKRFCRIHGINDNTYRVVLGGHGRSKRLIKVLKDAGYIQNESDLHDNRRAS